ncbi:hypothetical protein, partial [Streptomyces clavuligerus]
MAGFEQLSVLGIVAVLSSPGMGLAGSGAGAPERPAVSPVVSAAPLPGPSSTPTGAISERGARRAGEPFRLAAEAGVSVPGVLCVCGSVAIDGPPLSVTVSAQAILLGHPRHDPHHPHHPHPGHPG